jgi:hypothetical protein
VGYTYSCQPILIQKMIICGNHKRDCGPYRDQLTDLFELDTQFLPASTSLVDPKTHSVESHRVMYRLSSLIFHVRNVMSQPLIHQLLVLDTSSFRYIFGLDWRGHDLL